MRIGDRLRRLEQRRRAGKVLPVRIISQQDGIYRDKDGVYSDAEVKKMEEEYQLIIVCYGDWPPAGDSEPPADDGRDHKHIQLTWGDDETC